MMPTFFSVKRFQFFEQIKVVKNFYNLRVFALDTLFFFTYLLQNPFQIAKKKEEKNIYGETPLTLYDQIAQFSSLDSDKTFLELGSGRGRGALFLAERYGCKVVGVDWVSIFVKRARYIRNIMRIESAHFVEADFLDVDLSKADVVYIYGTCFSDSMIQSLLKRLKSLRQGGIVVTVSYSLIEYDSSSFLLKKQKRVTFPWGKSDLFYNVKN